MLKIIIDVTWTLPIVVHITCLVSNFAGEQSNNANRRGVRTMQTMQTMQQWQQRQWLESRKLKRFLKFGSVDCCHTSQQNPTIKTASPIRLFVQGMLTTQANESELMPSFDHKLRIVGVILAAFAARRFRILQLTEPEVSEVEQMEKPIVETKSLGRSNGVSAIEHTVDGKRVWVDFAVDSYFDSPTRETVETNEVRHDSSERRTMPHDRPRLIRVMSCVRAVGGYADDFVGPLPIGAFSPVVCLLRFDKPKRTINRATYLRSHSESWDEYVKHFKSLRKLVPVESQQTMSDRRSAIEATIKLMSENRDWKAKLDYSAEFIATFNEPGRRYLAARRGNVALQFANSISSDNGTDEDKKRVSDVVSFRKRNEVRKLSITDAKRLDRLDKLAKNNEQTASVVELLMRGSSQRDVAKLLEITRPKVKKIIAELAVAAK
jgi:hypothetical protein